MTSKLSRKLDYIVNLLLMLLELWEVIRMKKILVLCTALIMLMGSVCSASQVRFYDGNLNDFVTHYNNLAQEFYNREKIDAKLYQRPFKNATLSDNKYTAYTCKVGNVDKMSPYITFYVNKSGYVSHLQIEGYAKDHSTESPHAKHYIEKSPNEKLFVSSIIICVQMTDFSSGVVYDYITSELPLALFYDEHNEYSDWSEHKKRGTHIDTKPSGIVDKNKKRLVVVKIYADNDRKKSM